eukprot:403354801
MESTFLLTFKDPKLQKIYDQIRNKDIRAMNLVSLLFRILIIASYVLKNPALNIPIEKGIMVSSALVFGCQIVFSIATWKRPDIFAKHSAPVFLLLQVAISHFIPIRISGIYELSSVVMLSTALGLLIYVSYSQEKSLKNQVLQLHQIQNMNEELQTLFNNLPEGIALYDPITMKISLMNEEFKRLFNIKESAKQNINEQIEQKGSQNKKSQAFDNIDTAKSPADIQQIDSQHQSFNIANNNQQQIIYSPFVNNGSSTFIEKQTQEQFEKCLYVPRLQLFNYGKQQSKEENINQCADQQKYNILEASKIQGNNLHQQYFKILPDQTMTSHSNGSSSEQPPEYLTIQESKLSFKNQVHNMILTKNITTMINYENIKIENYFYEMLTATVSHDMRTPLNAIQGLLKNLELFINDPRGKKFLQIIQNSSSFLTFLVNDLLDFFQIKNGKFRINNSTVDLQTTFQNLVEMFSVGANEKGLQVLFIPEVDFPKQIKIDEQRTKQILLNLLQNALKFTFKGSIHISLCYEKEDQQIRVSVADTGVGIKKEDQEKLFKIFGKLEQTSEINTSGIGLGLGICKNLVEMLGGKISIDNDYQNGAKFTFTIKCEAILNESQEHDSCFLYQSEDAFQNFNQPLGIQEQQCPMIVSQLKSNKFISQSIQKSIIDQQISNCLSGDHLRSQNTDMHEGVHLFDIKEFYSHKSIINNQNQIQSNFSCCHKNIEQQNITENKMTILDLDEGKIDIDFNNDNEFYESKYQDLDNDEEQQISTNPNCHCEKKSEILVVDDNIFNLVTIQSILELKFGLKSDRATHGLEAFELFKQRILDNQIYCDNPNCPNRTIKGYNLILMDCNMPIMDGFQSTLEIRQFEESLCDGKQDQLEKSTIIALTAYTADLFKQKCFEVGMNDFLTKPVSAEQIEQVLKLSRSKI